jgi:hypothetical protein
MASDFTLLDIFESVAHDKFGQFPTLQFTLEHKKRSLELKLPKKSIKGFDLGASVETYGIYPWAEGWHGAAWEPWPNWPAVEVCNVFFGFLRTLLSPDARLRQIYRRNKIRKAIIDIRGKNGGWNYQEEVGFFVLPYGNIKIVELQNDHIGPRFPYADLQPTLYESIFYW